MGVCICMTLCNILGIFGDMVKDCLFEELDIWADT